MSKANVAPKRPVSRTLASSHDCRVNSHRSYGRSVVVSLVRFPLGNRVATLTTRSVRWFMAGECARCLTRSSLVLCLILILPIQVIRVEVRTFCYFLIVFYLLVFLHLISCFFLSPLISFFLVIFMSPLFSVFGILQVFRIQFSHSFQSFGFSNFSLF